MYGPPYRDQAIYAEVDRSTLDALAREQDANGNAGGGGGAAAYSKKSIIMPPPSSSSSSSIGGAVVQGLSRQSSSGVLRLSLGGKSAGAGPRVEVGAGIATSSSSAAGGKTAEKKPSFKFVL